MAAGPERTRRKAIFGRYMQGLRERCEPKLTPDALARETHAARTTITRMEGGLTTPGFLLVRTLLGIYGATEEERHRAEQLWEAAKADTTRIVHADDMPAKYRAFRRDESDADFERTLDTVIIPGMLQTPGYAAEVWQGAHRLTRSPGGESIAAAERQTRQELLRRKDKPLKLHALIDEAALRRMLGGPRVMAEQLDHLLAVGTWANVTIQVLPFALGAYGPLAGPMILLSYDSPDEPDVAYLEYIAGGESVENEHDVAALSAVFDDAARKALNPRKSAAFITVIRDGIENR
ncbi:helix-turn-helix domain-containing protein [Amycolatopsis anabasis]|uniref:helix-turn-helix domain-containing protein n=1 Tax=Amycolatopsis anabasis TaxID=1840409 RepID=UPI00131E35EE|nr:helix-turn-helix transcriptional regulator [Amycolatopsis anabasis]